MRYTPSLVSVICLVLFASLLSPLVSGFNFDEGNFNFNEEQISDTLTDLSCSDNQIAKWNATSGKWYCASDEIGEAGTGDITSVTAGANLSGGGETGDVTLSLDGSSVRSWLDNIYVLSSNIIDQVGNWSADKSSYYTSSEIDSMNTSNNNYIAENNQSVNNYILYVNSTNGDGGIDEEVDPYWESNWSSYNDTWSTDTDTQLSDAQLLDKLGNWSADKSSYYTSSEVDSMNTSQNNWIESTFVRLDEIIDQVGNWSADKVNYYTKTEVDAQNTSQTNYINENNESVNNYILYVNSTNGEGGIDEEVDPYWEANWSAFNDTWSTDTDTNTNIIDDNLYNSSELEEQGDGNLGILNSFIEGIIEGYNYITTGAFDQDLNTTSYVEFASVNSTSMNTTSLFIDETSGNCDTSLSGNICRNSTGLYLVG